MKKRAMLCFCIGIISSVLFAEDTVKDISMHEGLEISTETPLDKGWTYTPPRNIAEKGFIKAGPGSRWSSPEFPCSPFQHYIATFRSKSDGHAWYSIYYYDKDGEFITADTYANIYRSADWTVNRVAFRGRETAETAKINFISANCPCASHKGDLYIDSVQVKKATLGEMLDWADSIYSTMNKINYKAEPGRWRYIPETIRKLEEGGTIRIVMLGDSIINDTSNSNFEILLQRIYPKADIKVITSVRGSTGCWYYREPEHFKNYVADRNPDLLFIGGISHRNDIDAVREVIRMTREELDCEIMVASGPVGSDWRRAEGIKDGDPLPKLESDWPKEWEDTLSALAAELKVEYFDMATAWHNYLAESEKPSRWFHRDFIHADDRGKQVLARLIEIFFTPDKK